MKRNTAIIGLVALGALALSGCTGAAPSLMDPEVIGLSTEVETYATTSEAGLRGSFRDGCYDLFGLLAELESEGEFVNGQMVSSDEGLLVLFKEVNFKLPSAERAQELVGEIGAAAVRCEEGASRFNFEELGSADVGVAWKETQNLDLFDIDIFSVQSVSSKGSYFTFYYASAEEASGLRSNDLVRIGSFAVSE